MEKRSPVSVERWPAWRNKALSRRIRTQAVECVSFCHLRYGKSFCWVQRMCACRSLEQIVQNKVPRKHTGLRKVIFFNHMYVASQHLKKSFHTNSARWRMQFDCAWIQSHLCHNFFCSHAGYNQKLFFLFIYHPYLSYVYEGDRTLWWGWWRPWLRAGM